MGAISTIALRDLKSFFRSLTGPTVFFLFLLFIGIFFYGFIAKFMGCLLYTSPSPRDS